MLIRKELSWLTQKNFQNQKNKMESTESLLKEILIWTKVGMYASVKNLIISEFEEANDEKKVAFELLDGERSQSEIVDYCKDKIPDAKISNASLSIWTKTWEKIGLVERNGSKISKNFSLLDFGFTDDLLKKL